jgi:hypothetical protein
MVVSNRPRCSVAAFAERIAAADAKWSETMS